MAHIPEDANWFIAELVEEITLEGDPRNVVHKNLILIRADSPETAYGRALVFGRQAEDTYENPAGKKVRVKFCGLGDLIVIHDKLEDGAELLYEEKIGVSNEDIEKWILPKERLSVFRPCVPTSGPDYSDKEIMEEAQRLAKNSEGK